MLKVRTTRVFLLLFDPHSSSRAVLVKMTTDFVFALFICCNENEILAKER